MSKNYCSIDDQDPNDLSPRPPKARTTGDGELNAPGFAPGFDPHEILPEQVVQTPATGLAHHLRRKMQPITRGALDYFPDALLAVSELSRIANEQHNPGEPMHWAKGKSTDHADCLVRHLLERGQIDATSGLSHTVSVAWRALALLQTEIEAKKAAG